MEPTAELDELEFSRAINLAVPIFNTEINYESLFYRFANDKDRTVDIYFDSTNLLYLSYVASDTIEWNDLVGTEAFNTSLPIPLSLSNGSEINETLTFPINIKNETTVAFDSVIIGSGDIGISFQKIQATGTGTITINEITQNGLPLTFSWNLQDGLASNKNIAGYKITPQDNGENKSITYQISFNGVSNTTLTKIYEFNISTSNFTPLVAYGNFGTDTIINKKQEKNIDFFENFAFPKEIQFNEAKINLSISNNTGVPFEFQLKQFDVITDKQEKIEAKFLTDNKLYIAPIDIKDLNIDEPTTLKTSQYTIDEKNSNIFDIINSSPIRYKYNIVGVTNPYNENNNFITTKTRLCVNTELYFPIKVKIDNLLRLDTIGFDINNIIQDKGNSDYIDELALFFEFENGFPLELGTQAYFANDMGVIVDSLFKGSTIMWEMPKFDTNDRISERSITETEARLNHKQVKKLSDADVTKIILKSRASTLKKPDKYLGFYKEYGLHLRFAVEVISSSLPIE